MIQAEPISGEWFMGTWPKAGAF